MDERFDGQAIGIEAEPADHTSAGSADKTMVPELLTLVDIRDMHFHGRGRNRT